MEPVKENTTAVEPEDMVQVGCIRCKRTKATEVLVETAQKTLESIFDEAFGLIQSQAKDLGITVDDELHSKLIAWGEKNQLFYKEAMAKVAQLRKENEKK